MNDECTFEIFESEDYGNGKMRVVVHINHFHFVTFDFSDELRVEYANAKGGTLKAGESIVSTLGGRHTFEEARNIAQEEQMRLAEGGDPILPPDINKDGLRRFASTVREALNNPTRH